MGTICSCSYLKHFTTCGPVMLFCLLLAAEEKTSLLLLLLFCTCVPGWILYHISIYLSMNMFSYNTKIFMKSNLIFDGLCSHLLYSYSFGNYPF